MSSESSNQPISVTLRVWRQLQVRPIVLLQEVKRGHENAIR